MKAFFRVLLICILLTGSAFPQKVLTLKDAISIALKKSYGIRSAELSLTSSEKTLEAAKLGLMTSINMQFDLPRYSKTLSSEFNPLTGTEQFYEVGNTTFEGRLYFTQPIVFTNGTFSLVGSMWKRSQFSQDAGTPADYYTNLSLRLQQPLFTFNTQKADLKRAEINMEKSQRNYTKAEADIVYSVTSSFYRLYQAMKNVDISREKVKQNQSSYETALNKFKAGLIAEVEELQLETELSLSKNDLLNAEQNLADAKDDFKLLIGLDIKDSVKISADINYKPVNINLDEAVKFALDNRTELQNAESDIELGKMSVDQVDSRGNISGLLSVNYGINKNDTRFQDIFHAFAEDRSLAFTLSVPVLDWGKNNRQTEAAEADLKMSKLNYDNEKQQIEKEIISVVHTINSAKARVEVLSKSVELAQKSYNISVSRFNSGNITSFDLSQTQLRLTDAKVNSLNALIDYKLALADLARRTLHDFEKDGN